MLKLPMLNLVALPARTEPAHLACIDLCDKQSMVAFLT
jgi:hypothetical protein